MDQPPRSDDTALRAALASAAAQRPRLDLPAPTAAPLDLFHWRVRYYLPDLAADWTGRVARLTTAELPALGQLIDRTHDWLYNRTVENTEAFAARTLAHLADLRGLWELLDAHVHSGRLVPPPADCPVCQRLGREP